MAGKLKDKRVLVTGGGTGIGREIAQVFLGEGARVVICGRRHGPLKESVEELSRDGREIHFIECDISDPEDAQNLVEETIGLLGGLDVLVNNAGIYEGGNAETASLKSWDLVMNVNLRGAFVLTKLCLPHLKDAGRGSSVLNISSTMATQIEQHTLPYAVSKAGIEVFTRCCAVDYGESGVRFNAISPGVVDTPMQDHNKGELGYQEWRSAMERIHPMRSIGMPKDVAAAALYLTSTDADWLTGVILQVDGGLTAQ